MVKSGLNYQTIDGTFTNYLHLNCFNDMNGPLSLGFTVGNPTTFLIVSRGVSLGCSGINLILKFLPPVIILYVYYPSGSDDFQSQRSYHNLFILAAAIGDM